MEREGEGEKREMEAKPHGAACDVTEGGADRDQSERVVVQPRANGPAPHHSTEEAPPPLRSDAADSDNDSLIDSSSKKAKPASGLCRHTAGGSLLTLPPPPCESLPPSFTCHPPHPPPTSSRSSTCSRHHHHQSTNHKCLTSSKSHASSKWDTVHIEEARDDRCVHCLLACLYCQPLSMCSILGECLACGVGGASCCGTAGDCCCCCCVEAAGDSACSEEACQAALDCGMLEGSCGSSDFLEICLECCAICFPS